MNRRSLFGRFAAPILSNRAAERPDYFKVNLEPLEQRQMLAGNTVFVNDTWIDANGGSLVFGDAVSAGVLLDPNSPSAAGTYGIDCFGKSSTGSSDPSYSHIADAIAAAGDGDTVSLVEGTYTESDIIINKQVLFTGTGTSGTANTLIVPEVTSAQTGTALAEFGVGTHSGVIIYKDKVTVQNIHVDGNGGTAVAGTLNFHQGITTLYDYQAGGDYASVRNGNVTPTKLGNVPDPGGRPNRTEGLILIQNVRVDNAFWHGITLSALTGTQFGMSGSGAQNQVLSSVVNNVGVAGSRGYDNAGIVTANLDNYPNSSPDLGSVAAGTILSCTINNAGVGAATRVYGTYDQNNGARSKGAICFTTVNNAQTIGIEYKDNDGDSNCKVNTINATAGGTSIGLQIDNSDTTRYSNIVINNAHIGVKIIRSTFTGGDYTSGQEGAPILGGSTILTGPGTGEAGSVGVLLTNSASAPKDDAALGLNLEITNFQTGVKAEQPFTTVNTGSISGIADNGGGAIRYTTAAPHGLATGDRVEIAGITGVGISATNITGVAYNGDGDTSHARITVASTAGLVNGWRVNLSNIGGAVEVNGGYNIFNLTGTTFDVDTDANVSTGPAYTSGGTWTVVPNANGGNLTVVVVDATHFDIGLQYSFTGVASTAGSTFRSPRQSHLILDRPNVHGNAVGYNISGSYLVEGAMTTPDPVVDPGATFEAGYSTLLNGFYNSISNQVDSFPPATTIRLKPPDPLGIVTAAPTVGTMSTGNFSLDATSTLKVDITGNPLAASNINDFNGGALFYTLITETNPWRTGFQSPGALGTWFGNTTQSAGALHISSVASELGAVFDLNNAAIHDMRGMQELQVVAKKAAGVSAAEFFIVMGDSDGGSYAYAFPYSALNTATYTTLTINLMAVGANVQNCLNGINMSRISAWAVAANLGDDDMNASDSFGMDVDNIAMIRTQANSLVNVTGTVSLNGATLNAKDWNSFTPAAGQAFTIINNDGADAVSGTFAGLPEGTNIVLNNATYKISYIGGTGNDVTLTQTTTASAIAQTKLFYKGSTKWDVTNGTTFSDDNAIAPDKTAYLPGGGTATFAAVSSYSKGINGLMVDVSGPHGAISASDFIFKVGRNNSPSLWATATGPTAVTTRAGAGLSGSDRVELLWADNAVQKLWLEVVVKGNDTLGGSNTNTGLTSSYVFYFGNGLADSGTGNTGAFQTTSADEIGARNNKTNLAVPATRSNVYDYNRTGQVDSGDEILARNNTTGLTNQLNFLVVGGGGPFAPASSGGGSGDSGVASGLAASSGSSGSSDAGGPAWLNLRLDSLGAVASSSSSGGAVAEALADDGGDDADGGDDSLGDLLGGL